MSQTPPEAVFKLPMPDGTTRHFDALMVRRKLTLALPDWWEKVDELAKTAKPLPPGTPEKFDHSRQARQDAAAEALAGAVTQAFGLQPIDPATGQGCTENFRLLALSRFIDYIAACLGAALPLAGGVGATDSAPTPDR